MRLRVGALTHAGRVRTVNEDAYGLSAGQGVFVVCDGMGGAPAGDIASRIAVDIILQRLTRAKSASLGFSSSAADYLPQTRHLAEALRESNECVYNEARRDPRYAEMGTTAVGAWVQHNVASVAHVGDSRAYLWRNDRLEALTRDHSLVEAQVCAGLADRETSLQSEQQNILVRALGREPRVEVDVTEVPVQPGDYLLLCTDGLTRMVPEPVLARAVAEWRNPQRICAALVEVANFNGGADNITVLVVEVVRPWWRTLWSRWTGRRRHRADADLAV